MCILCVGCVRVIQEHLNCWQSKLDLKIEALRGIKEIGSILYWMSLLDIVLVSFLLSFLLHEIVEGIFIVLQTSTNCKVIANEIDLLEQNYLLYFIFEHWSLTSFTL